MEYRKLPHGDEQISIIGLGTSSIQAANEKEMEETLLLAVERGINYFDMASAEAAPSPNTETKSTTRSTSAPTMPKVLMGGPPTWTPSNALLIGS